MVGEPVPGSMTLQGIKDLPYVCGGLQLASFFETGPMEVAGRKRVVENNMSVINLPEERRTFLDAHYRRVAKFTS